MDREAIAAMRRAAGPCPSCGAVRVRPISYGLPLGPPESDDIVLGGCCVDVRMPRFSCGACGEAWS